MLSGLYREIEALGGAPIMDDYDEGYTDGLNGALAVLRKFGFGLDMAPATNSWRPIESAPRDGTQVRLWRPEIEEETIGSFRVDEGYSGDEKPGWFDNTYDDYSCGYASTPLSPTHWMPLAAPPTKEESNDHTTAN